MPADMENLRSNFCWKTPIVQEKVLGVTQQLIAPYPFGKNVAEQSTFDTKLHNLKIYYSICLQFLSLMSIQEHPRTFSWEMTVYKKVIGCYTTDCTIIFVIKHVQHY